MLASVTSGKISLGSLSYSEAVGLGVHTSPCLLYLHPGSQTASTHCSVHLHPGSKLRIPPQLPGRPSRQGRVPNAGQSGLAGLSIPTMPDSHVPRPALTAPSFLCCTWISLVLEHLTQTPWLQEVFQTARVFILCPALPDCVPSTDTLSSLRSHCVSDHLTRYVRF